MLAMQAKLSEKIADSVVKRLTEIRKQRGLSHEKVGELSGLHRSTISLIEARKREATLLTLLKICRALECSLGELLIRSEKENKN